MRKIFFLMVIFFASPAFAAPVQEIKTKSGITAWLVEEHSQPLIAVNIAFRDSGTAYDPNGKDGRTSMVAALLMEGAGDMDADAFNIDLENSALRLGFAVSDDNFYANVQSISEYKEKAFADLGLALTSPRFDDSAVARVKSQTLSAIKEQQEKPAYRLSRAWQTQMFGSHPYSKPELGTKESVENLETQDFHQFVDHYLTRSNMVVSVVGDITAEELTDLLDKNLSKLPETYAPDVVLTDITPTKEAKQTVVEQDIPQTIVRFGMQGIKRDDPDYIPAYVMNYMLGGGTLTSRLGIEIREKKGLAYSVDSTLTPMQHAALFQGGFATRNEKVGEAITALKATLKEYADIGASDAELEDAKRFLTGSFVVLLDSNASLVSFLSMMQLQHLGIDYMEKRNNLIRSVTAKQVQDMAKRLIKLDNLQVVMVGKPQLKQDIKPELKK